MRRTIWAELPKGDGLIVAYDGMGGRPRPLRYTTLDSDQESRPGRQMVRESTNNVFRIYLRARCAMAERAQDLKFTRVIDLY